MLKAPLDLKKARVLISNDDGIGAEGLKRLVSIARKIAGEVWVVAPETEQSGTGHSLTLRRPLRIRKVAPRTFAIDGTPTDCVLLAVNQIMKDKRPDLVLSGINRGENVGEDMTYSGTIAAAMEATLFRIPAIALSQYVAEDGWDLDSKPDWTVAEKFAAQVIKKAVAIDWPRDVLMNVNFPDGPANEVKGIEITREGRRKIGDHVIESADPRGEPYYWIGAQQSSPRYARGTDLDAIQRRMVSVTPLSIDLTHRPTMNALKAKLQKGHRPTMNALKAKLQKGR